MGQQALRRHLLRRYGDDPRRVSSARSAEVSRTEYRKGPGRPAVSKPVADLIVEITRENPGLDYDRIVGALSNLGYAVSDQKVENALRRHGISPAPKRSQTTTWKDFIAAHDGADRNRFAK